MKDNSHRGLCWDSHTLPQENEAFPAFPQEVIEGESKDLNWHPAGLVNIKMNVVFLPGKS